jgi:signal transduction histidine kinase
MTAAFQDRREAGQRLAEAMASQDLTNVVVLALPRGGVPVAAPVARALGAPLDLLLVRKIGAPGQPELAVAAVADGADPVLACDNESVAFTNSPDCEHVTGNSALLAQFGASAQDNVSASASSPEQYGRQIIYLREGHPVEAADLPLQQAARAGRVIAPVELIVRLPSGQERILEVSGAPIRDSEGQVIGAVTVSMDIGERKRAAQEREQARAKDAFLAVLGHELRNPLAAIATAVAALQREATAGGPGAMARVIDHQVEVLRRLVDDLLDISRLRQGVGRLQPGPVVLRTLLQDAAATVLAATTAQSQQLVVDPPPEEVHFQADRVRLQQVLANLLDNASKYGGPGCRIVLSGRREGDMVVLRCRDNGPGIAPEMQPRVFDPLVRLEPAGQQAPQGLGLGLALARQLVELHGGTIDLVSDGPGTGCEFLVRIPWWRSRPRRGRPTSPLVLPAGWALSARCWWTTMPSWRKPRPSCCAARGWRWSRRPMQTRRRRPQRNLRRSCCCATSPCRATTAWP